MLQDLLMNRVINFTNHRKIEHLLARKYLQITLPFLVAFIFIE